MSNDIIQMIATQSIFAVMFYYLLQYVLKTTAERETKYQNIISELTEKVGDVKSIKEDVKAIRDHIFK